MLHKGISETEQYFIARQRHNCRPAVVKHMRGTTTLIICNLAVEVTLQSWLKFSEMRLHHKQGGGGGGHGRTGEPMSNLIMLAVPLNY